jgi:uncharacterized protein (DUF58 family)
MQAQRNREILKAVRQVEVKTRRLVEDGLAGRYHSVFKGRGVDFADVRELTLLLMIDVSSSGAHGSHRSSKRDLAAEAGSALAFSAIRNNDRVGLLLFTDRVELCLPPRGGHAHILRIIREILFFEPRGRRTDLAAALDHANRVLKRRALAFLVSDFLLVGPIDDKVEALRRKLKATNRRHDVVAVSLTDPRELQLPDVGVVTLEDAETGERIEIDTSREQAREAYRRSAERYYLEIARCLRASGVDHLALSTAAPCTPALMALLRRRQARRAR